MVTLVSVSGSQLEDDGFVEPAIAVYKECVTTYSDSLHRKSIAFAEIDKDEGQNRVVTNIHVKDANMRVIGPLRTGKTSKSLIAANIGIVLSAALAGVGGGHLANVASLRWALPIFIIGVGLTVFLETWKIVKSGA